jgi:hypothetical protein
MKRNRAMAFCLGCMVVVSIFAGSVRAADESAPATSSGGKLTDDQMGEMLQGAILLARMGLYNEAEQQCLKILAQEPNQATVKQLLDEIQEKKRQSGISSEVQHRLDSTIVHELNVQGAPVADVIDLLKAESQKGSKDKTPLNFVWQAPEESKAAKVTLSLREIPLADALRYAVEGAGLKYRADAHAVVIYKPLPPVPKDAAPTTSGNAKPE